MPSSTIVWFRRDLRVADNPALHAAAARGGVVPIYILDNDGPWPLGGASRWWLHESLKVLSEQLSRLGAPLILRHGASGEILRALAEETGSESIVWNRCYEPATIARDKTIKADMQEAGIAAESFNATLLHEPWDLKTQTGNPFKVFTPFSRAAMQRPPRAPYPAPQKLTGMTGLKSDTLASWKLQPTSPDWAGGFREMWTPGETGALACWDEFRENVSSYKVLRDIPGETGTSRLSPYLAFGDVSPHQLWHLAQQLEPGTGADSFKRQIIWREFCAQLLYHFPNIPEEPLRAEFSAFPWRSDSKALKGWQRGQTGYPIVDAGMRELWHTGWMHNRVRMVVASFLVKHLLLPWRAGEDWFWDTLVDADLANNAANWQWVAGCGADAAPYFRIFNPVLQGEKFDADGVYVRRWVPEIAGLPDSVLHKPWEATDGQLKAAGIVMGETYPLPIVDHKAARARALDAFASLRGG